jgi:flagellar export protein FliJ
MPTFRLQRVLDLRKRVEEEAQQRFAAASHARVAAEQRLSTLCADEQRRREELSALLAGGRIDADRVRAANLLVELCGHAIAAQREEVARRVTTENEERARLTRAMVERKALDRLRERHMERVPGRDRHRARGPH